MITTEPNPYTGGQRVIAIGSPGNPEIITQQRLNQFARNYGKDLRSSHFEWFTANGLDLSGWNMSDCTFLDGTIANSNMLTAKATFVYPRRMAFPNTVMPTDRSILSRDFMRAIFVAAIESRTTGTVDEVLLTPYHFPVWAEAASVRAQLTNPNDRLEAQLLLDGDLNIVNPRHYVLMWEPQPCLLTIALPGPWGWWELDL